MKFISVTNHIIRNIFCRAPRAFWSTTAAVWGGWLLLPLSCLDHLHPHNREHFWVWASIRGADKQVSMLHQRLLRGCSVRIVSWRDVPCADSRRRIPDHGSQHQALWRAHRGNCRAWINCMQTIQRCPTRHTSETPAREVENILHFAHRAVSVHNPQFKRRSCRLIDLDLLLIFSVSRSSAIVRLHCNFFVELPFLSLSVCLYNLVCSAMSIEHSGGLRSRTLWGQCAHFNVNKF